MICCKTHLGKILICLGTVDTRRCGETEQWHAKMGLGEPPPPSFPRLLSFLCSNLLLSLRLRYQQITVPQSSTDFISLRRCSIRRTRARCSLCAGRSTRMSCSEMVRAIDLSNYWLISDTCFYKKIVRSFSLEYFRLFQTWVAIAH